MCLNHRITLYNKSDYRTNRLHRTQTPNPNSSPFFCKFISPITCYPSVLYSHLRSTAWGNYASPRRHRHLANRVIKVAAPSLWNFLPENVHNSQSYSNFYPSSKLTILTLHFITILSVSSTETFIYFARCLCATDGGRHSKSR